MVVWGFMFIGVVSVAAGGIITIKAHFPEVIEIFTAQTIKLLELLHRIKR